MIERGHEQAEVNRFLCRIVDALQCFGIVSKYERAVQGDSIAVETLDQVFVISHLCIELLVHET